MVGDNDERTPTVDGTISEGEFRGDRLSRVTAPPELEDEEYRKRWDLGSTPQERGPYLIELNVRHANGLAGAARAFQLLFRSVFPPDAQDLDVNVPPPARIAKGYFRCELNIAEWKTLIAADEKRAAEHARIHSANGTHSDEFRYRTIYKLWPDFPVQARITKSVSTIKADAALRSFDATGADITWAVIDSGINADHPHFGFESDHVLKDPEVRNLHRCFVPINGASLKDPDEDDSEGQRISAEEREARLALHRQYALQDLLGHGTHVAGIITGRARKNVKTVILVKEEKIVADDQNENQPKRQRTTTERVVERRRDKMRFHGVAPRCRLVSLRVLDNEGGGRSSNIVSALEYIREHLNDNPKLLRVHGVNLSVGYEFDAEMFACGQSPLCTEVNRLVQSGVVVVTAAGNTGYTALTANGRVTKVGLSNTINDPGNAEYAITVGSTHRDSPHTFGISYFSSKGPTGDGRLKPDIVAPGERIISCAAGKKLEDALKRLPPPVAAPAVPVPVPAAEPPAGPAAVGAAAGVAGAAPAEAVATGEPAYYVEDSGTSMAAPHVSGAIAAFLSIRNEFIGRPSDVKRIFLDSAIPLGRERYFEGHGLLDLMKAIQSV